MKLAVIGSGKWGSAIYHSLAINNECIQSSARNLDTKALDSEYIVISISTQATAEWLKSNFKFKGQKVLVASKGIDTKSEKFLNEIYESYVPKENLAFISGPTFAKEIEKRLPCALVISSVSLQTAKEFCGFFPNFIKAYADDDVMGAEICGAYKNVIAIAGGICDGLGLGNNARASLISRGLVEMARFGKFFGARDETFLGLSGAGDLFLTASSVLSRNYRVGMGLAKNESLEKIINELGEVAEGVATATAIRKISEKNGIYTPIVNEVEKMLNGGDVSESVKRLLGKK
ncbi:MAG: NAD(P)H-dependent glycerol-3-phosphate dehydrogenase [Campylobacter sp.]|nr:NAD(P)H-dependent glycerol-3-phosphate dehydrogenase [Campylobacter sp.]